MKRALLPVATAAVVALAAPAAADDSASVLSLTRAGCVVTTTFQVAQPGAYTVRVKHGTQSLATYDVAAAKPGIYVSQHTFAASGGDASQPVSFVIERGGSAVAHKVWDDAAARAVVAACSAGKGKSDKAAPASSAPAATPSGSPVPAPSASSSSTSAPAPASASPSSTPAPSQEPGPKVVADRVPATHQPLGPVSIVMALTMGVALLLARRTM